MTRLFPYPTLLGEPALEITDVAVDGAALPYTMISKPQQAVALHQVERKDWEEVELSVRVLAPQRELSDGPWSDVACVAVSTERATNVRCVQRLRPDGPGSWSGAVTLLKPQHRDRVILGASVVATVDGVSGRVIGSTPRSWVVDLKAEEPAREREPVVTESDFRDGPHEWLRPFKDSPWLVDVSGDTPMVHLNTAFEGVAQLLNGSGGPLEKATGSLISAQLASDVWTSMFHAAVSGLDLDEDGTPRLPEGWRGSVLRTMLPDVLPSMSLSEALHEVHSRQTEGPGWAELQSNIHYAASRRAQVPRRLTMAIRTVDRSQEGTPR
ncbi:hypothetical protein [Streptomyces bugieae]|uniref:Uncharacterized protein n=1 Tax=Streptomyces bugieae TaxID=3098223 RepID=A0ABU7P215_9ACTN|nr:hypothetical protein [Streptomyces sp. DSM 41528]